MSRSRWCKTVALGVAFIGSWLIAQAVADTVPGPATNPTLYKRLGGYDAIAALSDDIIGRLATDRKLNRFFVGLSDDSKLRFRQLFVDQLCAATGGPCVYVGRDMKTAHKGLNITESDWQAMTSDVNASLDKFAVKEPEREGLAAILSKLKPDIVTAK